MVPELEFYHCKNSFGKRLLEEKLLDYKNQKLLVVKYAKLEDRVDRKNRRILGWKESKRYVLVVGFVDDGRYKLFERVNFNNENIYQTKLKYLFPLDNKEQNNVKIYIRKKLGWKEEIRFYFTDLLGTDFGL